MCSVNLRPEFLDQHKYRLLIGDTELERPDCTHLPRRFFVLWDTNQLLVYYLHDLRVSKAEYNLFENQEYLKCLCRMRHSWSWH